MVLFCWVLCIKLGFVKNGCVIDIILVLLWDSIFLVILGVLIWFDVIIGIESVFLNFVVIYVNVVCGILVVMVGICVLC